ncbi:MAG: hypothetical protein QW327_04625 [Candidatus Odinarchaeota archaeon]
MVKEKIKENTLTLAEVKSILQKREKEGELSYVQRVTLDYVGKMTPLTVQQARNLSKELVKMGVSENTAVQIVNALPEYKEELTVFLTGERDFTPEEVEEILKKIKEYKQ